MRFTRDAEREADRLGAENVVATGHDPRGMITFFEKLGALRDEQANAVEWFFASHPDPDERISNIEDLLASPSRRDLSGVNRSENDLTASGDRFGEVKRRLAELPPLPPVSAPTKEDAPGPETGRVDPVPVTYPGSDQDYQIAACFAPVFHTSARVKPSIRLHHSSRLRQRLAWRQQLGKCCR